MIKRFWTRTHGQTRNSLARLLRDFHKTPEFEVSRFRAMVSAFNTLLGYYNIELSTDLEKRIERLEELIEQGKITKYRKEDRADFGEKGVSDGVLGGANVSGKLWR